MPTQTTTPAPSLGTERWSEVLQDPRLRNLPYKIETNARGQIVLSPHKKRHSDLQGDVLTLLVTTAAPARPGRVRPEYPVETADGVKVPDVIWISASRDEEAPAEAEASPLMPELCIEVLSASNTEVEMKEKRHLFFERGAEEVWIVEADGGVRFFDPDAEREHSKLAPDFPRRIGT